MKKLLLLIFVLSFQIDIKAQQIMSSSLDINNINARVNSSGDLFWDFANGKFEVPKGSGNGTVYADNLWIGGLDAGGNLKMAGQTYRQTGTDFWPGALKANGTLDSANNTFFNKVWSLKKCDIEAFHNWVSGGILGASPVDSLTEYNIINWPAVNSSGGPLAPYFDSDNDGSYNSFQGDYPLIKGDQAIFFVYNDKGGVHTETGGISIGVEIQTMVYSYNCSDSALQNSIFVDYKIVNKSPFQLHNVFIGKWTDFDIGYWGDDYVGCDVSRGAYFGYNGDNDDEGGYSIHPGAQGIVFLKGAKADPNGLADPADSTANGNGYGDGIVDNEELGMTRFIYYNNNSNSVNGNPSNAFQFYNYLTGYWKDSTHLTYGGNGTGPGVACNYMMPGDSDPTGFGNQGSIAMTPWDEQQAGILPGDRKGLASTGPFTFQPGATQEFEIAYVFGRDYSMLGAAAGVEVMKTRIDTIKARYKNGIQGCGCSSIGTGINNISSSDSNLSLYPNPSSDIIYIDYKTQSKNATIVIYDVKGQIVKQIKFENQNKQSVNISTFTSGLYLMVVTDGKNIDTQRFIKQ
jgi:hypothetical protein